MPRALEAAGESPRRKRDKAVVPIHAAPPLVWQGAEYPRLDPGIQLVRAVSYQGPEWVRRYNRWSLRIEFALVATPGSVSAFFNMGSNPEGPHIGRQSRYWRVWTLANGGPPLRGQSMSPDVFLDDQFFRVSIADATQDSNGKTKADAEVYSRITEFHSVERP